MLAFFFTVTGMAFWWCVGWIAGIRAMRRAKGDPEPHREGELLAATFFFWPILWPVAAIGSNGRVRDALMALSRPNSQKALTDGRK